MDRRNPEMPIHEASTAPAVLPPLWLRGASSGDEVAEAALAGARIVPTGGGQGFFTDSSMKDEVSPWFNHLFWLVVTGT